jgi:hypothetical protein
LKPLSILSLNLLRIEPVIEQSEDRTLDILESHSLGFALFELAVESSREEGRVVSDDVLMDAELFLGIAFANDDGDEAFCIAASV